MKPAILLVFSIIFGLNISILNSQTPSLLFHKCGVEPSESEKNIVDNWGYSYDDLLADIEIWQENPYVSVESIGSSVQNRDLWQLTITSDEPISEPRKVIYIHARTHPNEVQAWWVTAEIISQLLSEDGFAQALREKCIFYIIPMYNPDGVELEYPRKNAHGIDIESNWNESPPEPEVIALKARFTALMQSETPIEIALNMHSAYACKRYFVYHDVGGTSFSYTQTEKEFINGVRSYFMAGIENWNYYVSWSNSTPTYYPESWFWLNYGEEVLALTYEDGNCDEAGQFDQSAYAILQGISDQLGITVTALLENDTPIVEFTVYPNPVVLSESTSTKNIIQYELTTAQEVQLLLMDNTGRQLKVLDTGLRQAQTHRVYFDASSLSSGIYYYVLKMETGQEVVKMMVVQ